MIRAVVFDKDGTLFDFQQSWSAWARALIAAEAGDDRARASALAERLGFDAAEGRFRPDSPVIAETAAAIAAAVRPLLPGRPPVTEIVARLDALAARTPQVEAVPLAPLLARLRGRGLALGVATNDGEAPARAHLDAAGVAADFDFVAGCDSGHGAKPGPGPLLAFARAVGVPPAACAMVGDSLHDLHAARAAGMAAVAVLTGVAGADDLAPAADVVLENVSGLPDWLDQLS